MKALLIGSSFSALPLLLTLKEFGASVTVVGSDKSDPCHALADNSIFEDYSDANRLLEVCKSQKFDYIVPSCNDYAYLSSSYVANQLGLPGFDSEQITSVLHSKEKFRELCASLDISTPKAYGIISPDSQLEIKPFEGKALLKPVDSFSGRGIQLLDGASLDKEQIAKALSESRSKLAILEQFVPGDLYSHTAFIEDGKVVWHDFVDEFCETYPYQVSGSSYPSSLADQTKTAVHQAIEKLVQNLGLADGLLHTQFISDGKDFWLIETMRRCPGDLYGLHFKFSFGFDYGKHYLSGFLGRKLGIQPSAATKKHVARQVITSDSETNYFAAEIAPANHRTIFIPLKNAGESLKAAPRDKAGIIFSVSDVPFETRPKAKIQGANSLA